MITRVLIYPHFGPRHRLLGQFTTGRTGRQTVESAAAEALYQEPFLTAGWQTLLLSSYSPPGDEPAFYFQKIVFRLGCLTAALKAQNTPSRRGGGYSFPLIELDITATT
jgi:hypothetical protein